MRLLALLALPALLVLAGCDGSAVDGPGGGPNDDPVDEPDDPPPGRDDAFDGACPDGVGIRLDPTGTYLRVHESDPAAPPTVIDLDGVGAAPGDALVLGRRGEFQIDGLGDPTRTRDEMIAVFSRSDVVLGPDEPLRVPDAIDAGDDFRTLESRAGYIVTDIPEDFAVDQRTTVVVPPGAAYLIVAGHDSEYWNNTDDDEDFRVCVE